MVVAGVVFRVQPAVSGEVLADLVLEDGLVVLGHRYATPRTSIFPVTASVISAERYSRNVSIIFVDLVMSASIAAVCSETRSDISCCSESGGTGIDRKSEV